MPEELTHDSVDHPRHYVSSTSGVECIEITEWMPFCLGNALKYLWRLGQKGDAVEDARKALWYVNRQAELPGVGYGEAYHFQLAGCWIKLYKHLDTVEDREIKLAMSNIGRYMEWGARNTNALPEARKHLENWLAKQG